MATNPPVYSQPGVPAPKKSTSPIVWILSIIGGLFVLGTIAIIAIGMFVVHKAKQAGLDPDLLRKNPGLAAAKMVTAANPDLDLVSTDEGKGVITVRDKRDGKLYTMSFEDAKDGRMTLQEGGKPAVTMSANADGKGSFEIKSSVGSLTLGAGGKLPEWIPAYPGAQPEADLAVHGNDGDSGSFHFKSKDAPAKIASFYTDALKSAGMMITGSISGQVDSASGQLLTAADEARKRNVIVTIGEDGGENTVNVAYTSKK